jgi:hypothetical protein
LRGDDHLILRLQVDDYKSAMNRPNYIIFYGYDMKYQGGAVHTKTGATVAEITWQTNWNPDFITLFTGSSN